MRTEKKPNIEQRPPLVNICSTEPIELVSIDCLPLDKPERRYEHFTRFVQAYSTKNKSGCSAAEKIFNELVFNYSFQKSCIMAEVKSFKKNFFNGFRNFQISPHHQPDHVTLKEMNNVACCLVTTDRSQQHCIETCSQD